VVKMVKIIPNHFILVKPLKNYLNFGFMFHISHQRTLGLLIRRAIRIATSLDELMNGILDISYLGFFILSYPLFGNKTYFLWKYTFVTQRSVQNV